MMVLACCETGSSIGADLYMVPGSPPSHLSPTYTGSYLRPPTFVPPDRPRDQTTGPPMAEPNKWGDATPLAVATVDLQPHIASPSQICSETLTVCLRSCGPMSALPQKTDLARQK